MEAKVGSQSGGGGTTVDGTNPIQSVQSEKAKSKKKEKRLAETRLRNQHHDELQTREDEIHTTMKNNPSKVSRQTVHGTDRRDA